METPQPGRHDVQTRALQALGWAGLACTLGVALLSLLHIAAIEFGPLAHLALNVDETYFAACAARGTATGEIPISGCHDSKAPPIYLLYQIIQPGGSPYDTFTLKAAALTTVAIIAVLVGWIAFRLAGAAAAVVAPALLLQPLVSDSGLLALKTETVGAVFLLGGLVLLTGSSSWRRCGMLFAAGLLLGLAALTKQTYAVAGMAVILWVAVSTEGRGVAWLATSAGRASVFCMGALLPFLVFLGIFYTRKRHIDFLASVFLYPSIYGGGSGGHSMFGELIWRAGAILDHLSRSPSLFSLFVAATVLSFTPGLRAVPEPRRAPNARLLILLAGLFLLAMLMVLPKYFAYHGIPAWVPMAILGSLVIGDYWPRLYRSAPGGAAAVSMGLLAAALLPAASSWLSNGGRDNIADLRAPRSVLQGSRGEFGYVLGTWPHFYFYNGLIPATAVQFPWALPGTPGNWHSSLPDPASLRGRLLARLQERNLPILLADFQNTPPRYILVMEKMARRTGSTRVTDVPGLDDYLRERCAYSRLDFRPENGTRSALPVRDRPWSARTAGKAGSSHEQRANRTRADEAVGTLTGQGLA